MLKYYISAFIQAWNMLIDIPLPSIVKKLSDTEIEEDDEHFKSIILFCFPVVGTLLGIIASIIAWIFISFAGNLAAAIIASIIIVILYEIATAGRNMAVAVSFSEQIIEHKPVHDAFFQLDDENSNQSSSATLFMLAYFLLRVLCIGTFIYYFRFTWFIGVFSLAYAIQAQLALSNDLRTSQPIFELENENSRFIPWCIAGIIAVLFCFQYIPYLIIAFLVAYLAVTKFQQYCDRELGGVTGKIIGFSGYFSEILLLIMGVMFLIRQ